ncbi:MAG: hypothetical protein HQ491_01545 [Bacteroidetes bacterium]|mgnify:FL=1|jgi:hypothetical protein|nr:hypothetical protein [Bacteroidota bacterium]
MKIKYTALLILVLVFSSVRVKGQESGSTSAQNEKRAQNVFVELGGQGLLFTANYDSRFSKRMDGLGGRVGIGYISIGGDNATTVPLSLNYLLGTGRHFFEMGLGATLLATSGNDNSFLFDENNSNVIGTMSFSYRLQPVDQGFSFRAGLTPIFNKNFFIPYYAGLSLGYSF